MCVDVQFVDPASPQTALEVLRPGRDYQARVSIQDDRGQDAAGIFQAYFDVLYDAALITLPSADIQHGSQYSVRQLGDASTAGSIDAAGGTSRGIPENRDASYLLFQFGFQTDATGTLTLDFAPDNNPSNRVEFFPPDGEATDIGYVGNAIPIRQPLTPVVSIAATTGGSENGPTAGRFTVSQAVATATPTVVSYTVGGTATSGSDFTPLSGSVTIPAGTTSAVINVPVVDDAVTEASETVVVTLSAITSGDPQTSLSPSARTAQVSIQDNDTAGILVTPTSGLQTSETGGLASFQVSLTSRPTGNVNIPLSLSDTTEGTLSTTNLVFTASNWNVAQTVSVRGLNDNLDDGDVAYRVVTAAATSSDGNYNGRNAADVELVNIDDDTAGITINAATGLTTTEAGLGQSFTVRLSSQPTADVVIGLSSSDSSEGTPSPTSLRFTPSNWNVTQTVTVTGVDDAVADGDQAYTIRTAAATSADASYDGFDAADVSLINQDDDVAGYVVDPTSGLTTGENGDSETFTVRLQSQPTANVSLGVSVDDTSEGSVNQAQLTFSPANWQSPQTVRITGVDDDSVDGDVQYRVRFAAATSSDSVYQGTKPDDLVVTNTDDDVVGVRVDPTSGLVTGEAGPTASFSVVLTSAPTADVTLQLSSSDPGEGVPGVDTLTFTPANWNTPQTVTVSGVEDDLVDGAAGYAILTSRTSSADPLYNNLIVADVSVTNQDNDTAAAIVAPTSGLVTGEDGSAATFTVRLTAQPTADVIIPVASSDPSEGTVSTTALTFTPQSWNVPQTVTVSGVDDDEADGDVAYAIQTGTTTSTDAAFNGLTVDDVSVTNLDDDEVAVLIAPVTGLITGEDGSTDQFTVRLASRPTANVTIDVSSSDPGEALVDVTQILFTPQSWNQAQTITVTGQDDDVDDGDVAYRIVTSTASSDDPAYHGLAVEDVLGTNENDDTAAILVTPPATPETSESGGTATFSVVLGSQPTADVVIALSSSNPDEGTADQPELVFTPETWNAPQTVVVNGQDDLVDDGDVAYTIILAAAGSDDPGYAGLDADDVSLTNLDDDVPGIAVVPTAGLEVSETGQNATFDIVLTSQPTADVTIPLASSDSGEATLSTPAVTFTPDNWNTPQRITVTGVDDDQVDGTVQLSVRTAAAVSADPIFSGIDATDVAVRNLDDDRATLSVADVRVSEGDDPGAAATLVFTAAVSHAVAGGFSVDFATAADTASQEDFDARSGTLRFQGTAGETQTISVPITADGVVEADETLRLVFANVGETTLGERIDLPRQAAVGTIANDDTAAIVLDGPASVVEGTGEALTQLSYTVRLVGTVQDGFSVNYASVDGSATVADGDFVPSTGTLNFAGDADETHTITVNVAADDRVEPDETFQLALQSIGGVSATVADAITLPPPAQVTITNDDFPRLLLSDVTASSVEGSGGTTTEFRFQLMLSDPVDDPDGFEVPFQTIDGTASAAAGDYQSRSGTVRFAGTAGEVQTVSVLVQQDTVVETDETFTVALGTISGLAPGSTVVVPTTSLQARIVDDDSSTVTLAAEAVSVDEGGQYRITATLSAAVQGGLEVDYVTTDGTATVADGDYSAATGTLAFSGTAGEQQTFLIQTGDDNKVERHEAFQVALANLAGLPAALTDAVSLDSPLALTIRNDDSATVTLSPGQSIVEGDSGTRELEFTVSVSAAIDGGVSIPLATTDGTATAASDYTAINETLTFSGSTAETRTIRVQVAGDDVVEGDETFSLGLGALQGLLDGLADSVSFGNRSSVVSIENDDTATLTLVGPGAALEGTSDAATAFRFTVRLEGAVQDGFSVGYATSDGSATVADGDYLARSAALTFSGVSGQTQTVDVLVTADERVESDETFRLRLGEITGLPESAIDAVQVVSPVAVAEILNDDFPRLLLTDVTASHVEGTSPDGFTEFRFAVTLSDDVDDVDGFQVPVEIQDGTATVAGGDYLDNDTVLQFGGQAGEQQIVTVRVRQDAVLESDETFKVALGEIAGLAAGQTVLVPTPDLAATIRDDDSATLTLQAAADRVTEADEGTTAARFTASLSAAIEGGFTVAYQSDDQSASVADEDYVDNDGVLAFLGEADESQSFEVLINGDRQVEADETFAVSLGTVSGLDAAALERLTVLTTPLVTTIRNDDAASLRIVGPGTVIEGTGGGSSSMEFAVTLDHPVASAFTVAYETVDGTATVAGDDYTRTAGQLQFVGGVGETQTIRVPIRRDAVVENDETLTVRLTAIDGLTPSLQPHVQLAVDTATATIANDDTARIGFVTDASTVLEADGTLRIGVRLDVDAGGSISQAVSTQVIVRSGSTAEAEDFVLQTATVTFPAGSTDGTVRDVVLTLTDDGLIEDAETIVLALQRDTNELPAVTLGTQTLHTATVIDDAMDASLAGRVWVDANGNRTTDVGEMTLAGVMIRLRGTTLGGETIERTLTTDQNGVYRFTDLPAGTYALTQVQPEGLLDGAELVGRIGGVSSGRAGADTISEISVSPSQQGRDYLFAELGLDASSASRYRFLARPRQTSMFGNPITAAMLAEPTHDEAAHDAVFTDL